MNANDVVQAVVVDVVGGFLSAGQLEREYDAYMLTAPDRRAC